METYRYPRCLCCSPVFVGTVTVAALLADKTCGGKAIQETMYRAAWEDCGLSPSDIYVLAELWILVSVGVVSVR